MASVDIAFELISARLQLLSCHHFNLLFHCMRGSGQISSSVRCLPAGIVYGLWFGEAVYM